MVLPKMQEWALKKGIDVLSAADFTHPLWFRELKAQLIEGSDGVYELNSKVKNQNSKVKFILSTEISSIYSQGGKTRRIHNLVFMPSLESVEKFNTELLKRGANLAADGRPIIGLSSRNLFELVLSVHPDAFLIPCHAWTPWFSIFGSNSGFDSIEECFQDLSSNIYGIETGLSSDPEMNWRIKELDNRSILSFSDAHSGVKMGREATVFELGELSFANLKKAIQKKSPNRIAYTIEFYPEEGKYHYTGHRNCGVVQSPEDSKANGVICKVCKRPLTVGVMERVEKLGVQGPEFRIQNDENGVKWVYDGRKLHPPYVKLVPLVEVLSESLGSMPGSLKVLNLFDEMVGKFGSELKILLETQLFEIEKGFGEKIAASIKKVREQDIYIAPGFDGEYGKVKIWADVQTNKVQENQEEPQLGLF